MHLVLVTDAWHPQVNGVVRSLGELVPRLERRGWRVTVVHPGLLRATVPLPVYPEIRLALFPKRKVRELLKDADAVHIATEGPLGSAARSVCLARKIPFTTSFHTNFHLYANARMRGFHKPLVAYLRRFHRPAAAVLAVTPRLVAQLHEFGLPQATLWPLGVDTDLFARNPSPKVEAPPGPVFAYVGRVSVEKSVDEFLELDLPGSKLVVGDGPARAALEKKYGGRARFLGYRHGQELVDWLSACDVLVFPSRTETFGLVIIEALACGVPVAAHEVMGPQDILTPGTDGYLSEDLQDAALTCLSLSREECRKSALRYSWEASADAFAAQLRVIS